MGRALPLAPAAGSCPLTRVHAAGTGRRLIVRGLHRSRRRASAWGVSDFPFDFFLSRCGASQAIATEVARVLEGAGYRVLVQDHDFARGGDFVADIHDALVSARNLVVLHTEAYDQNYWTRKEFTNFVAAIPMSRTPRRLCVLCCDESRPRGILANVVFGELAEEGDSAARRDIILGVAEGRPAHARHEPATFGGRLPRKLERIVGRETVVAIVEAAFADKRARGLEVVALSGLGGVGKSTLARALVDRLAPDYAGVWWLAAGSATERAAALAGLGARLAPAIGAEPDIEKAAAAALAAIERTDTPFLLVYDDAEAPEAVAPHLPSRGAHVIVTTRRTDWVTLASQIDLEVLGEDDAVALLQARAGRVDEAGARRLARTLGYLPLALDQAAAYVHLAMKSFDQYAQSFDKLAAKKSKLAGHPATIAATFALAIDAAVADYPAAEAVLGFCAFVAAEKIPRTLLEAFVDEDELGDALMALGAVSLIRGETLTDGAVAISLHSLVQAAARARLAEAGQADAVLAHALSVLAAAMPAHAYDEPATWPLMTALMPHVLAAREQAHARDLTTPDAAMLYDRAGEFLHARSSLALAEALFVDAIAAGKQAFGPESAEVARSMNRHANLLRNRGRGVEAEALLRAALAIQRRRGGDDDADALYTSVSLAGVLADMGQLEPAESLLREAVATSRAVLGPDHRDVALRITNLAVVLARRERLDEAEALLREAIDIGARTLGRDHPQVADRLNNLATVLQRKGESGEAEALFREALAVGRTHLGADHPSVGIRLQNLANLLRDDGRGNDAHPLYKEALAICERTLGDDHVTTARVCTNFARLLLRLGQADAAVPLAARALRLQAERLGADHAWTRDAADILAAAQG